VSVLHRPSRPRATPWLIAAVLLVPLAAGIAAMGGEQRGRAELAAVGATRAQLYREQLVRELERPANLLLALSRDPLAEAALDGDRAATARFDVLLSELAASADLTDVYLMDLQGATVAASNSSGPRSFVGHNFSFRGYFTTAMAGSTGREFALGTTSLVPGYYVAQPVRISGQVAGAVVAKVALARLEELSTGAPERLLLSDRDGRVLMSDLPEHRFQPMPRIDATGQLLLSEGGRKLPALATSLDLPWEGWRLTLAQPLAVTGRRAMEWGAMGGSSALVVIVLAFARVLRRHDAQAWESIQRQARQQLEAELKARTAELVQAAKLATIGQMAAGMVHEINQPLAAMAAFAGNAGRFLDLGREDKARANLGEISALVERLAGITRRLKDFSRRPAESTRPVALAPAVDRVLALLGPRMREYGVELAIDCGEPGLAVLAEQVRLEQVLINLAGNAIDAMTRSEDRWLSLRATTTDGMVAVTVADSGPGIPADALARIFDPFVTTKPAGEGLGLGLSIATAIIRGFGGTLTAANRAEGGAVFTLTLPRAEIA